jgi:hypothetical protein
MSIDFFEEGKKRRFMSCDKAEEELMKLLDEVLDNARTGDFWDGYRWHEPEVKQKANKK